ncbi:MAG: hypothetical protein KF777_13775 [Planctomycetaceae bacterium]|nr:hypothetical protein [Planctomycetaceae bacterium]
MLRSPSVFTASRTSSPPPGFASRRLLAAMFLLAVFVRGAIPPSTFAQEAPAGSADVATVGWQGKYRLGYWSFVRLGNSAELADATAVEITVPDPEGHEVHYRSDLTPTSRLAWFRCGQLTDRATLTIFRNDEVLNRIALRDTASPVWPAALPADREILLTIGSPGGFDQDSFDASGIDVVALSDIAELPDDARALDAVTWLVVNGPPDGFSPTQIEAIQTWVQNGGRLLIALGRPQSELPAHPLLDWLPVTWGESSTEAIELAGLEAISGRNTRIPMRSRPVIPRFQPTAGVVQAKSQRDPLLARLPVGFGEVTLLAFDLSKPPLTQWVAFSDFTRRLTPRADARAEPSRPGSREQIASTGVTDLGTQVFETVTHDPRVSRPTPWLILVLILGYAAIIGPLDYLLVQKGLKRPLWAWVTLPAIVAAIAWLSASAAVHMNGSEQRARQLSVADYDAASGLRRETTWWSVMSPESRRADLAVSPDQPSGSTLSRTWDWFGPAESTFGGLYRKPGMRIGLSEYWHEGGELRQVPLLKWGTKAFFNASLSRVESPITVKLSSNSLGRLSGTVEHRLDGVLEDWMLAYANRIYLIGGDEFGATAPPWNPGEPLDLNGPRIVQRELRAVLMRTSARSERATGKLHSDIVLEREPYDAQSRDPYDVARMLTFHGHVADSGYTGLTNRLLTDLDLSRQLSLGRAVLFARLRRNSDGEKDGRVALDGKPLAPSPDDAFVRLILPVESTGEIPLVLPKLTE